jgi:putative phage-type endonuclease
MLKPLVSTENLSKEDWLKFRNNGIGGSDAAVVCGISKYKSPFELWMEKTGKTEPKESGEAAYWGTILEPIIRDEFEKRSGYEVCIESSILQHPYYPFMLANVDGIVINADYPKGCLFEAKTASAYLTDDWEEGIPEAYFLQVQHYLAVTNFAGAYVAVLIGGNHFKWKFIPRDEELITMLIKIESKFWEHVTTNTPPPIDGSDSSSEFLGRLYSLSEKNTKIELPDKAADLIAQFEEAQEAEKAIVLKKNEASNKLKSLLGSYETGIIGDRIVSWTNVNTERFDSALFKTERPDIYSQYLKNSSYRRFVIK